MEVSIFLAKVIGFYLIIMGLLVLVRPQAIASMIKDITQQPGLVSILGVLTLILGLLLVISHNIWVADWRVLITLLAWLTLISGIVRLFFQDVTVRAGQWWLTHRKYLIVTAIIYLIIGIYLLYHAYNF